MLHEGKSFVRFIVQTNFAQKKDLQAFNHFECRWKNYDFYFREFLLERNFYLSWYHFFVQKLIWNEKCIAKAMSIVQTSFEPCEKHVNHERTKKAWWYPFSHSRTVPPCSNESDTFSFFLLFTTDLNGLVKFFISTDEINLPRTWVVSFFLCYIKEELLRSEEGEKENLCV